MKKNFALGLLVASLGLGLAGCSCGGGGPTGDGLKSDVNDQVSQAYDLAKKVNGDYTKLTPEEKQVFLKMTNNNEEQAIARVKMIAHPPNEKYLSKPK